MKCVHLGIVGRMIATPITVAVMDTKYSASSSSVIRRRIWTLL
jgi:hypothetical protein